MHSDEAFRKGWLTCTGGPWNLTPAQVSHWSDSERTRINQQPPGSGSLLHLWQVEVIVAGRPDELGHQPSVGHIDREAFAIELHGPPAIG